MFYLNTDKTTVVDHDGAIVGFVVKGKFRQVDHGGKICDLKYRKGLTHMELEQISEAMQR